MIIELRHQKQKFNWDCGIACVFMVLSPEKRDHFSENFENVCREEGFGKSTWTIDLCYLLHRYKVQHKYVTQTLGVNPDYFGNPFYDNIIARDGERVNKRFEFSTSVGLQIVRGRVVLKDILNHLDSAGPIIVLTNSRLLKCDRCKVNKLQFELRRCLRWTAPPPYQGHYIVLCGHAHSNLNGRVFYRNPSLNDHICSMTYESLDAARSCYGTDEDVIFIHK